jgi:hypothetical protein
MMGEKGPMLAYLSSTELLLHLRSPSPPPPLLPSTSTLALLNLLVVLQEISGQGRTCTGLTSLYSSQFGHDADDDDAEEAIKEMDDKDNGEDDEEEEDVLAIFESQYCSQHGLQNT